MKLFRRSAAAGLAIALAGCVSVPQGPTVAVMPGAGKSPEQFGADTGACQQLAQASVAGPSQYAQNAAASNAVGGAALGAAVGALFGAATGQAGTGAAWGAGAGLMVGSAGAANAGAASSYGLQRQYDAAYMQCMYTKGNQVPMRVAQRPAGTYYPPPSYAPPPPAYAPPPRYGVPPNALVPPPGTPPPQGYGPPGGAGG